MVIELSSENGPLFLDFEVHGLLTTEDLRQIVEELDDDHTIQKISIELATEQPASLELPNLIRKESTQAVAHADSRMNEETGDNAPEEYADAEAYPQSSNPTDAPVREIPKLQPGSDPFAIMRIVGHHDEWLRTKEIADAIPTEWGVSGEAINSNLWNLENRGLVQQRPYEDDKRQNEYRITRDGEQALKHATDLAENLRPLP